MKFLFITSGGAPSICIQRGRKGQKNILKSSKDIGEASLECRT